MCTQKRSRSALWCRRCANNCVAVTSQCGAGRGAATGDYGWTHEVVKSGQVWSIHPTALV